MIAKMKREACKLLLTAATLLGMMLLSAVVYGEMPLWAGLLSGAALLCAANAACGVLLAGTAKHEERAQTMPVPAPQIRVARGGRAA